MRAQSELAAATGCRPAASSGRSLLPSSGMRSTASITPLPMLRVGVLTTRRRLTSSCGFMMSRM